MEKKPEVRFKVDVVITEETLRDYLMQRTYSNAGIIIPTLFGIGFLYLAVTKWGQVDMGGPGAEGMSEETSPCRDRCPISWMTRAFTTEKASGTCCPGTRSIISFLPSAM